ncbi:MAG TPA: PAS domain S-box protein, partial [Burkholderiaceae bacterium]|nr:PAS domain S-box protein [Burkholderiaceae bacterium]
MTEAAHPLSERFEPAPRRSLAWLLPMTLALMIVGGAAGWLQINDTRERDVGRQLLVSDTLSLEQQLRTRINVEQERLSDLALLVGSGRITQENFGFADEVLIGLRRHWISVIWLDENNRIVTQAPEDLVAAARDNPDQRGLSAHIDTPIVDIYGRDRGRLVVRYALAAMLKQETPWWIAQRHAVRLVDGFGELLATTAAPGSKALGQKYRVSFTPPFLGVFLELQQRQDLVPWYRATPLILVLAVMVLLSWATYLTWRQMRRVARAEAAWRGEVAWRRAIEDALTVGLRARDMEGRLLYVNRRLCELTGFTESELVGCLPPMPYWPPHEIEEVMQRHLRNMAGGAPAIGYEARWRSKDGREIIVMLFEAPLIDPSGKQVGWLGSVVDVTGLRRAEEIEQHRAERAADQSRLMVMGEIAASLAHELNQPLTAIASYGAGIRNALKDFPGIEPKVLLALKKQGEQVAR